MEFYRKFSVQSLIIIILSLFFAIFLILTSINIELHNVKENIRHKYPQLFSEIKNFIKEYDTDYPNVGRKLNLPIFRLILSRKDVAHFSNLYGKYLDPNFGIDFYAKNNVWRKAELIFMGEAFSIKIKAHGKQPDFHKNGKFISYAIKLEKGKNIWNARRFNLIIRDHINSDRHTAYKIAEKLGVLFNKESLVRVKINNWEEKLYFFDHRFRDEHLEKIGKSSYRLINYSPDIKSSSVKTLLNTSNDFNDSLSFLKNANKAFLNNNYPIKHKSSILEHHLNLNIDIQQKNYSKLNEYFDLEYLSSFEALRILMGNDYHQYVSHNFYIFHNFADGKFYPGVTRDLIPRRFNLKSDETIEKITKRYNHLHSNPLLEYFSLNDKLRLRKYRKLYDLINLHGQKLIDDDLITKEYHDKLHLYGWFNMKMRQAGRLNDGFLKDNISFLKTYLEDSNPKIEYYVKKHKFFLRVIPNSMSPISFKKLSLQFNGTSIDEKVPLRLKIFSRTNGAYYKKSLINEIIHSNYSELPFTNLIDTVQFSTAINEKDMKKNEREYILVFESKNLDFTELTNSNINNTLINSVTNKELVVNFELIDNDIISYELNDNNFPIKKKWEFLDRIKNLKYFWDSENELRITSGSYNIYEDVIVPKNVKIILDAGVSLILDQGVSIVCNGGFEVRGNEEKKVSISSSSIDKPFGTIAVLGKNNQNIKINHLSISGGSADWIRGTYFSGGMSIHYSDSVYIDNSIFSDNKSEDGLNVKNCKYLKIDNCIFKNNFLDQVDLDYCVGTVANSQFFSTENGIMNGDGLDLSGSDMIIYNNSFKNFADKGVSTGEESNALIVNNFISNNNIGIAIKDLSIVYTTNNEYNENAVDLSAYQKKSIFGGGHLYTFDIDLQKYSFSVEKDKLSNIYYKDDFDKVILSKIKKNNYDVINILKELKDQNSY